MPQVQRPDLPQQVTRDIGEHEVLIAFNGDDEAVMFEEWWQDEGGFEAFAAWAAERENR
jgi:hypothetical protein